MLPSLTDGAVRLESTREDVWLEIVAVERLAVAGQRVPGTGAVLYPGAEPSGADVVLIMGDGFVEDLRVLHSAAADTRARYTLRAGPGVRGIVERRGRIETLDRWGRVVFHTSAALAVDARGKRRRVTLRLQASAADGALGQIVASFDSAGLLYPIVVDPSWLASSNGSWPSQAIVGLKRVDIHKDCLISGDIAVVDVGHDPELKLHKDGQVVGSLQAHRIELERDTTIDGDVDYNERGPAAGLDAEDHSLERPILC